MKKLVLLLFVTAACTEEPASECAFHDALCLVEGDIHCVGAEVRTCVTAEDGCLVWTELSSCDDGLFCNGEETCSDLDGCVSPGRPCEGEYDLCDEEADACATPTGWKTVTAGGDHTCAIDLTGVPYCWGRDKFGQLGNGDQEGSTGVPGRVDTGALEATESFVGLSAGDYHTCGLTDEGRIYCWGLDYWGQVGDGGSSQSVHAPTPLDVSALPEGVTFSRLASGSYHSCALTAKGDAYCWGGDWVGQLGDGWSQSRQSPVPVRVDFSEYPGAPILKEISVGSGHACAQDREGRNHCWGSNSSGQVANWMDQTSLHTPVEAGPHDGCKHVSAGGAHTCAIMEDDTAYCWGAGYYGQLGTGELSYERLLPVDTSELPAGFTFARLSCGAVHTCGVSQGGEVACWGAGWLGETGTAGDEEGTLVPVLLEFDAGQSPPPFERISSGDYHACAIGVDGRLFCWGSDNLDQLGDGGRMNHAPIPRLVDTSSLGADVRIGEVNIAMAHSCGVLEDGTGVCWGEDRRGQIGNAVERGHAQIPEPIDVSGLPAGTGFETVQAGTRHSCGLTTDGDIYCWGANTSGVLGIGRDYEEVFELPEPIDVDPITTSRNFVQLGALGKHSCALADDGIAYCWGRHHGGPLGCGDQCTYGVPNRVDTSGLLPGFQFLELAVGGGQTCGLANDGYAYCWGDNFNGSLGNPAVDRALVPVPVEEPWPAGESQWQALAAGGQAGIPGQTCGLNTEGELFCWGNGYQGQRGDGSTEQQGMSPVEVDTSSIQGADTFVHVAAGWHHTCAIAVDQVTYCWGDDEYDQLGANRNSLISSVPLAVDTSNLDPDESFVQLTGGAHHTCGLTNLGRAFCWGYDRLGMIGDGGPPAEIPVPAEVAAIRD